MNVKNEIEKFAKEEDKPILLGLFSKYHMSDEWHFVANVKFESYGKLSIQSNRIWSPTEEGRILYKHLIDLKGNT